MSSSERESEGTCSSEGGFSAEVRRRGCAGGRWLRRVSVASSGMSSDSSAVSTDVTDTCKHRRRAGCDRAGLAPPAPYDYQEGNSDGLKAS